MSINCSVITTEWWHVQKYFHCFIAMFRYFHWMLSLHLKTQMSGNNSYVVCELEIKTPDSNETITEQSTFVKHMFLSWSMVLTKRMWNRAVKFGLNGEKLRQLNCEAQILFYSSVCVWKNVALFSRRSLFVSWTSFTFDINEWDFF